MVVHPPGAPWDKPRLRRERAGHGLRQQRLEAPLSTRDPDPRPRLHTARCPFHGVCILWTRGRCQMGLSDRQ